jgi:hypothetical protein
MAGSTGARWEGMRELQEASAALLRGQRARELAISQVQAMKAQLARERREKREREVAFLQAQATPLVERLVDLRNSEGRAARAHAEQVESSARPDVQALQAVVHEAMHRARAAQDAGLALSSRLCMGADVQRSACGSKLRVVVDASHLGVQLERYAIILQLRSCAEAEPERAADDDGGPGEGDDSDTPCKRPRRAVCGGPGNAGSESDGRCEGQHSSAKEWVVLEHSLPRFIPVAALAARHLPTSMRSFVERVRDYVQAFVARREQWLELLRLHSSGRDAAGVAAASSRKAFSVSEPARRVFCVQNARRSDAYDQLSFTIGAAGGDGPRAGCGWRESKSRGHGSSQESEGATTQGATRFCVQLVFEDLRRCFPSRASVLCVDVEGTEFVLHPEDQKRAQAQLLQAGQRLADSVPLLYSFLSSYSW